MSSRGLTWHDVDECTYRFGSRQNGDAGKSGDRKPVTKRTVSAKPTTSIAKTKETKTPSMANTTPTETKTAMTSKAKTKPTTETTLTIETADRDEQILRMLYDAIF